MKLLSFILCLTALSYSYGQKRVKYGKVPKEDLQMTVYQADSSASAVVLYDKGNAYGDIFTRNNITYIRYVFERHVRIKILKKSGSNWGNFQLLSYYDVEAQGNTYNLVNGEVQSERLKQEHIKVTPFIRGLDTYKIFFPNVKEGSVIELKYIRYGIPYEWRFQERIPVRYSELKIEPSFGSDFTKSFFGFEPYKKIKNNHWVAENMPAFVPEDNMNHYSNYITKIEFMYDMSKYSGRDYPSRPTQERTNWSKLSMFLNKDTDFGKINSFSTSFLDSKAQEIKRKKVSTLEKIQLAYDYIHKQIKWNKINQCFISEKLKEQALKHKSGTSADVNHLLIELLNKAGIKTNKVVLSTRENGIINPSTPNLQKLDYVVGMVKQDNLNMLIDGTSRELRPGILPTRCLNGFGWEIQKDSGQFINLNPKLKSKRKQFIQISHSDESGFKAQVSQSRHDYNYLEWLYRYKKAGDDQSYHEKLDSDYPDLAILSYSSERDKSKSKVSEKIEVDLNSQAIDLGQEIAFTPYLFFKYMSNPLKTDTRRYPLDLTYPIEESSIIKIQIPENLKLKSLPESVSMSLQDNSASFLFICKQQQNNLTIQVRLNIKSPVFDQDQYLALKNLFSTMLKKIEEPILFQKNT